MIPLPGIRDKGGGPQLGARHDGEAGPFGIRGAEPDEDDDGDGLDDEQHDHTDERTTP